MDLFADADLRAIAPVRRLAVAEYPKRLPELLRDAPPGPVIYTGALENHPAVIERIARERVVWGNRSDALKRVRDPFRIFQLLRENGLPALDISRTPLRDKKSLRKPRRGAGGQLIALADPAMPSSKLFYFQEFMEGPSFAAIFCGLDNGVELLGVTEQLIGEPWLNAKPFHYCGSIGPVNIAPDLAHILMRIGEVVRADCGLRGLFGIDYILNDGRPWLVEINPRYTASIEVLERATGLQALDHQRRAFTDSHCPVANATPSSTTHGKAILFATHSFRFPDHGSWTRHADIPNPGDIIEAGWPILTIFAEGADREECWQNLNECVTSFPSF